MASSACIDTLIRPLGGGGTAPAAALDAAPTMGGEDFAYLLEKVPGAMVFLGIGNATLGTDVNLHNPRFQMDEAQMSLGAALHVEMALRSLAAPVGGARPCADSQPIQGSSPSLFV